MEINKTTIAGILALIIILSSGTTIYLQSLGEKTSCKNGWKLVESGQYEGYYSCTTSTKTRYELCFSVYDSANTEDYWCEKGKLEQIEKEPEQKSCGNSYTCYPKPEGCKI